MWAVSAAQHSAPLAAVRVGSEHISDSVRSPNGSLLGAQVWLYNPHVGQHHTVAGELQLGHCIAVCAWLTCLTSLGLHSKY